MSFRLMSFACLSTLMLIGCMDSSKTITVTESQSSSQGHKVNPENWPKSTSPIPRNSQIEARVQELLGKMTLEEKVGQVIQADIGSVTPEEAAKYHLGSILNGGNSAPNNDNRTAAENWLALADAFWLASVDTQDGGVGIPIIWGTDAVHGHNNIVGATVFPHNIGLGAANDPMLMKRIGQVTAAEIRVTGIDWTFAPTLAVVRDDRWGRTYESYSEDPQRIAEYAAPLVEGLQGTLGNDDFLNDQHVLATAKHFLGDGGTVDGIDQGDNQSTEAQMRDIHAAGYPPAIQAGAQVVMASYNSWFGKKMHGSKAFLTDVLVDRMGFDGFVVGDWNGHGQVLGCSKVSCPQAFNAGLDMFMAPDSWQDLYENTLDQVKSGLISMDRLDQAVERILRVKLRAGLFEAGKPSERPLAGKFELLGSTEHRQVAREAVRKSLVLLKNNGPLLPLNPATKVLVAGEGADNIGMQSGGWTLSWQGTGNANSHFPNGQSIYAGIAEMVNAAGGAVELSVEGEYKVKPDVAIAIFGEQPYAEFQGDRAHLDFASEKGLSLLTQLREQGIPTVAVFLSGRPMWVNPELNQSDAFVAAWLPGTEGGGIADLLFTQADGTTQHDFTGRLSFSWPATPQDAQLNYGEQPYQPLFPLGYGLSYADSKSLGVLNEQVDATVETAYLRSYVYAGDPVAPWNMLLQDATGEQLLTSSIQTSTEGTIEAVATDDMTQEDTIVLNFSGPGALKVKGEAIDLTDATALNRSMQVEYQVLDWTAETQVNLTMECGEGCSAAIDVSQSLADKNGKGWQSGLVHLSCFANAGADMQKITSPFALVVKRGAVKVQLRSVMLISNQSETPCSL